jgi:hypothetical protein
MNDELDQILADQLMSARRRLKMYKKLEALMPHDPQLIEGMKLVEKQIIWYESLIGCPKLRKKKRINIRRTISNIYYMVRFIGFYKVLLGRNKKGKE